MSMEIKPKIGVAEVSLGQTMAEVREVWGDPESIDTFIPIEETPEDRTIDWFFSPGIELSFDSEDDFRLASITCESNVFTYEHLPIVGISVSELKLRFPKAQLDEEFVLAVDEYRHSENSLSFYLRDGVVTAVTLFPEYTEDGREIIWPKQDT